MRARPRIGPFLSLLFTLGLLVVPAQAAAATVVEGVTYARRLDAGSIRLDVHRPSRAELRPIVVLVHGGGWWLGSRSELATHARALASEGYVVASIDYRLACGTTAAPRRAWGHGFHRPGPLCGAYVPAQVADVRDAVAFMRRNASRYGGDPRRIALAGSSAGGHLALLAAANAPTASRVRAVVSWSGASSTRPIDTQDPHAVGSIKAAFTNAVGCKLSGCPERWDVASPLFVTTPGTPRFAVLQTASVAEPQVPARTQVAFDRHVARMGWTSTRLVVPGSCHSRDCLYRPLPRHAGGGTVWSRTLGFLRRSL